MLHKPQWTPAIGEAGREIVHMLEAGIRTPEGVHVGTLVSAAAKLGGTSLFRSFNFTGKFEPGQVVLSDRANDEWPRLGAIMLSVLKNNHVAVDDNRLVLKDFGPHTPRLDILEVQRKFGAQFASIAGKHQLDEVQAAWAGAVACGLIIHATQTSASPQITCGVAMLGFVEGAKTVPLPIDAGTAD